MHVELLYCILKITLFYGLIWNIKEDCMATPNHIRLFRRWQAVLGTGTGYMVDQPDV